MERKIIQRLVSPFFSFCFRCIFPNKNSFLLLMRICQCARFVTGSLHSLTSKHYISKRIENLCGKNLVNNAPNFWRRIFFRREVNSENKLKTPENFWCKSTKLTCLSTLCIRWAPKPFQLELNYPVMMHYYFEKYLVSFW